MGTLCAANLARSDRITRRCEGMEKAAILEDNGFFIYI